MEVEVGLPKYIVVKSDNNKYLSYVPNDILKGFLQFHGKSVSSSVSKMAVEMAETGDGHHVHLRCCYSNKYWVKSSPDEGWIVAKATKPEEDMTKWNCTLFKLVFSDDDADSIQFVHVQSGHCAGLWRGKEPFSDILYVGTKTCHQSVFKYVDWDSLVILPNYIAFKKPNGKYLNDVAQHLKFSARNIAVEGVGNQIYNHNDGTISLKCIHDKKFWDSDSTTGRVLVDMEKAEEEDPQTNFFPFKVGKNVIALRNTTNGSYCHPVEDTLRFNLPTITKAARFQVEELVTSREVYDVKFRLEDARIYNESSIVLDTQVVANNSNQTFEVELKFKYVKTSSKEWNNSLTLALDLKFRLKSNVPYITDEKEIGISNEVFDGEYTWGEIIESANEVEQTYKLTVPPMTKASVTLVGERANCDVPFTYSQCDVLVDGSKSLEFMNDDGVFIGDNFYAFEFVTKNEPIVH